MTRLLKNGQPDRRSLPREDSAKYIPTPSQIATEAAKIRAASLAKKITANPKVVDRDPRIFTETGEENAPDSP